MEILNTEQELCFLGKLMASVKSKNKIYKVDKVLYKDGNISIGYKINGFWYRCDEKRRGWGSLDDIVILK